MNMQAVRPERPTTLGPDEARNLPTWRAAFSERTAELMAKLALLAYETDPEKLSQLLKAGEFTLLAAYDQDGSQAFLARADDLSWGTKSLGGAAKIAAVAAAALGRRAVHTRALAARTSRLEASQSTAAELRARQRAARVEARRNAAQREAHWATTNCFAILQVLLSIAIAAANTVLNSRVQRYLLYTGFATAAAGVFVQLCSFAYFLPRALCSRSAGWNRARSPPRRARTTADAAKVGPFYP